VSDAEETPPNGKHRATDRDKEQIDILVSDEELLGWLEQLFYAEPAVAHFPEKIDVHVMEGKGKRTFGQCLKLFPFAPKKAASKKATEEAGVQYMGDGKPTKEKLVQLTNQLVHIMRRDCDTSGRVQTYALCAWHGSLSDEPYDRTTRVYKPRGMYKADGSDEEELSEEKRFLKTMHEEHRNAFSMIGAAWEGVTDRDNRTIESQLRRIAWLEQQLEKKSEQLERALSLESEREEKRQWLAVKNRAADRGLTLVENYAPMLMHRLAGGMVPAGETAVTPPEVLTLRNFFKTTDEGGQLTDEQLRVTFGWNAKENTFDDSGILMLAQGQILYRVANAQVEVSELDKLIPGAEYGISTDQLVKLQKTFGMEQLGPLFLVFQSRQQAHAAQPQ
jgi:hypothetical protein